jgi:small redox-active disulfide protein 2
MTHIEVLGPGCARCAALYERAEQAAKELGLEYDIRKVTDVAAIARQGVLATPGLVVNGELKLSGRVPSAEQIKAYLS